MNVEEQVRDALQRAGHERHVDVTGLHASTRAELSRRLATPSRPTRGGWRPVVLAATAVAGLIAVLWSASGIGLPRLELGPSTHQGGVDDTFTCPQTSVTRFGPGNQDDSFLPELTSGLMPAGEAGDAPRWESARVGSGAVLRLGNVDGTLASVVRFEKTENGYRRALVTKCTNAPSRPVSTQLILDGLPVAAPDAFTAGNTPAGSVRVMDRTTYDVRGLAKRNTMWAEPCGETVCLVEGTRNGFTISHLRARSPRPQDATGQLADPDDMVGQHLGLRLIAVYDREKTLRSVTWENHGDVAREVRPVQGGGWQGQLFLFLVDNQKLASVTLHSQAGEARTYPRDELDN